MIFKPLTLHYTKLSEIRRLPRTWPVAALRTLLEILDIDDAQSVPDTEVEDMAIMALQDHEAEEAMQIVLTHFTDNRFTRGQIQHLREELKESCAWEEYPEIRHQRALYICVDLLNLAFPDEYPDPTASAVELTMTGRGLDQAHARHPLDAATLLRAIGRGQNEDSILNRFFSDQIAGADFPEAESAIWDMEVTGVHANAIAVSFHGSAYWFRSLDDDEDVTCTLEWPEPE